MSSVALRLPPSLGKSLGGEVRAIGKLPTIQMTPQIAHVHASTWSAYNRGAASHATARTADIVWQAILPIKETKVYRLVGDLFLTSVALR